MPFKKPIKVITFNMQYGQTWDPDNPDGAPVDLSQTIRELNRLDADIVFLQEVEQVDPDNGQVQPPPNYTKLREALPQYDGYFSYPPMDSRELPFGYGLAILSKESLFDTESIELPAPGLDFEFNGQVTQPTERLMIGAKIRIEGEVLQLYNTHLQAFFMIEFSSDDFPEQREVVLARMRDSKIPTIVGGDLNAAPGERTVDVLESAGFQTAQRDRVTWKRMPFVLDHIFYNDPLQLQRWDVVPTTAADHEILSVELTRK